MLTGHELVGQDVRRVSVLPGDEKAPYIVKEVDTGIGFHPARLYDGVAPRQRWRPVDRTLCRLHVGHKISDIGIGQRIVQIRSGQVEYRSIGYGVSDGQTDQSIQHLWSRVELLYAAGAHGGSAHH